jgi:hypothetical protein
VDTAVVGILLPPTVADTAAVDMVAATPVTITAAGMPAMLAGIGMTTGTS